MSKVYVTEVSLSLTQAEAVRDLIHRRIHELGPGRFTSAFWLDVYDTFCHAIRDTPHPNAAPEVKEGT
jgi:hypothetical protein